MVFSVVPKNDPKITQGIFMHFPWPTQTFSPLKKKNMFSHEKLPSIQSQLANLDDLPMLQMSIRLGPRCLGDHRLDRQPLADGTARGDVIRVAVGVEHKPQGEAQVLRFNHGKNGEKPWNTSEDFKEIRDWEWEMLQFFLLILGQSEKKTKPEDLDLVKQCVCIYIYIYHGIILAVLFDNFR